MDLRTVFSFSRYHFTKSHAASSPEEGLEALLSVEHARRHAQRTTYARRAVGDGQQWGSDAGQLVLLGVTPADRRQCMPLCNRRGQGAVRLTVLDGENGASLLVDSFCLTCGSGALLLVRWQWKYVPAVLNVYERECASRRRLLLHVLRQC